MSLEKNHSKALELIELQLGTSVKTDPNSLHRSSFDGLKIGFTPQALIQPVKKEEIGKVLTVANEFGVPVTTKGAGSSLTGCLLYTSDAADD